MSRTVVEAQKTKSIEHIDRGIAVAAAIQAIPTILWMALIVLLFSFIGMAVFFNRSGLEDFTSQVLTWLFRVIAGIGVLLLVKGAWRAYKLYHEFITDAQARSIGKANVAKAAAAARQAELKNEQLETITRLQRNLTMLTYQLADQGCNIELDAQKGILKAQNPQALHVAGLYQQGQRQLSGTNGQDPPNSLLPEPVDFSHILEEFVPSPNAIYLLNTLKGPVTVPLNKTCHIGLAGTTGGGKTNTLRMFLAQALACGASVYLANPNFAPVKINEGTVEDWRPIAARLAAPVARRIDDIKNLITQAVAELDARRERQQLQVKREREFYLVLGEWPAIVSRWKEAPDEIGKLLREARQYGIYVISEMQDALVKTIGGSSGLRECYRTVYYFGGDSTTARVLLDAKDIKIDETGLGDKGACYVRSYSSPAARGRVPFCSNAAIYALLGVPTGGPLPDLDDGTIAGRIITESATGANGSREETPFLADSQEVPYQDQESDGEGKKERITGALQGVINPLVGSEEATTQGPTLGPNDRSLNELQIQQFITLYSALGNIEECLKRIDNGKGQRLGQRYYKHASWLVKFHKLKKQQ